MPARLPENLCGRRHPALEPPARPHEAVRRDDPAAGGHREDDGEIGHIVVEHGRGGHDDAPLPGEREIGRLEADAHDGADLELRQRPDHLGRQTRHGVGDDAPNLPRHGSQRRRLVGRVDRLVDGEFLLERGQNERPLRPDYGDLDRHDFLPRGVQALLTATRAAVQGPAG